MQLFVLLNFYGYTLATGVCSRLHNLANGLSNSSVTADNHTGIVLCNGKNKLNVIAVNCFCDLNGIGSVNDGTRDVGKYFLEIHLDTNFSEIT